MKKNSLISAIVWTVFTGTTYAQDIPQSQVPSLVVNSFQQTFPKASDIDWEMDGDMYKVEFETGFFGNDYDVWYDKTGKILKQEEEISKGDLPQKITARISKDFSGHHTDDIKKITEGTKVFYKMELKSLTEDWKVVFDSEGNVLSKVED